MELIDCVDDYGINDAKIVLIFVISPFTSSQGATLTHTSILTLLVHPSPLCTYCYITVRRPKSSRAPSLFLGLTLFFVVSLHTQKLTHKLWPIATIIPLSPVVA
jgi:hypothetical protein